MEVLEINLKKKCEFKVGDKVKIKHFDSIVTIFKILNINSTHIYCVKPSTGVIQGAAIESDFTIAHITTPAGKSKHSESTDSQFLLYSEENLELIIE